MKKLCFLLALALILGGLAACGPTGPADTAAPASGTETPAPGSGAEVCAYTVFCYGGVDQAPVAGVIVNFCTDDACTPVTTDETGKAVFTGPPAVYHVQVVKTPAGWRVEAEDAEWYTEPCAQTFRVLCTAAGD